MASVTRKTHSTRSRRRDEARERLLGVVERLLDEGESYTEISVERLVQEAGMSRSTFYDYFEDKGDLLRAWFGEITAQLAEAATEWWTVDGETSRDDLGAILDRLIRTYAPHTTLMAATYDAAAYDPAIRELVADMMATNTAALRKHIREGQREGFVDPDLPPAQTAAWLTWMAERGQHQLVRGAQNGEVEALVEAYTSILWNTLYAPTRR
jgi:AcrR family transcriptional regulator